MSDRVLIAGGGIAGLAAGLALAQRGIPSLILEREREFSEAGAGIQIGPNGTHVLTALGVTERLRARVASPDAVILRDGPSGRELSRLPLGEDITRRFGAPYWVCHRADLQHALLDAVEAAPLIDVRLGFGAEDVIDEGLNVVVRASNGDEVRGRALIAADGLWSKVRKIVAPHVVPAATGAVAYRAVINAGSAAGRLEAERATGLWLGPGCHAVHYPVRSGREIACVLVADAARAKDVIATTWIGETSSAEISAVLSSFAPSLRELFPAHAPWRKWALQRLTGPLQWAHGRTVLTGDAAHPILPYLAQGGVMALEDAVTLAAAYAERLNDPSTAFGHWARQRQPRLSRLANAAQRNGRVYHLSGAAAAARNAAFRAMQGGVLLRSYDWLYGWRPEHSRS